MLNFFKKKSGNLLDKKLFKSQITRNNPKKMV